MNKLVSIGASDPLREHFAEQEKRQHGRAEAPFRTLGNRRSRGQFCEKEFHRYCKVAATNTGGYARDVRVIWQS